MNIDDNDGTTRQGWRNELYLHALKHIAGQLKQISLKKVMRRMKKLFHAYCLYIPLISKDRWVAQISQARSKAAWIRFDENGERMDDPDHDGHYYKGSRRSHSSWMDEAMISEEYSWNVDIEDAISEDGLRKGRALAKAIKQ